MKTDKRAVTWKALLLGACVAAFVNLASPYTESVGFSNFSWSYLPEGAAIPLLLILAVNGLLIKIRKQLGLTQGELLVVFVMALVANSTAIWLIYFFLAAIVSPHYFVSPENEWRELLFPYLPKWLIISDRVGHCVILHPLCCLYWLFHFMGSEALNATLGRVEAVFQRSSVFHWSAYRALRRKGHSFDHIHSLWIAICITLCLVILSLMKPG